MSLEQMSLEQMSLEQMSLEQMSLEQMSSLPFRQDHLGRVFPFLQPILSPSAEMLKDI